ncbi:MAG: hypothetical protein IPM10_05605 [Chitinophagaceae bacterium]|nr:hypothetical protein [Chitinophagaceae bacterium]
MSLKKPQYLPQETQLEAKFKQWMETFTSLSFNANKTEFGQQLQNDAHQN